MTESIETKYRPQEWGDVIGQAMVVKSLANAVAKRLGRAYLLTGPSGTGKTTLARIASVQLGCSLVDIEEADAATETGIDNIRKIIDSLMYRPIGEGAVKAIIIDEVHALSKQAVTALLKSLEDPPSWVYWFLCTTDPAKLPAAIKTRCLTYQLKEVGVDHLIDLIESTEEGKNLKEDIVTLCAEEAKGSPRQALSNLGVCVTAKTKAEAAELLRSAGDSKEAVDLARLLLKGADWKSVCGLLSAMKELNPESVRHVVRSYMTSVILSPKGGDPDTAFAVLEAFSQPFNSSDGMSPLVLACGRLVLGSN